MQGSIDIKISKSQTIDGQAPDLQQDREPGRESVQNQAVNAVLLSAGKQIITQGITQFGNLTGNYTAVRRFNEVLSIGSDIAIASTGPVGVIAIASKYALNIGNSIINQTIAERDIALQRERAGFISTQGSRYRR